MYCFILTLYIAKRVVPRGNPTEQPFNIDAKVLFPEVQEIPVIEGPSTTCKEPRKVSFVFTWVIFFENTIFQFHVFAGYSKQLACCCEVNSLLFFFLCL